MISLQCHTGNEASGKNKIVQGSIDFRLMCRMTAGTCSIWYFIAIFMCLHGPAVTCILGLQFMYMYLQYNMYLSIVLCHTHTHTHTCTYTHTHVHVIQNNLRTPQLVGFSHHLGYVGTLIGMLVCEDITSSTGLACHHDVPLFCIATVIKYFVGKHCFL